MDGTTAEMFTSWDLAFVFCWDATVDWHQSDQTPQYMRCQSRELTTKRYRRVSTSRRTFVYFVV
jgi:hypothetical protein